MTFLGLDYRNALLIILYFVVLGIRNSKIEWIGSLYHMKIYFISKKSTCLKWTNGHSNNDYTTTGITMQSLKSIGQF